MVDMDEQYMEEERRAPPGAFPAAIAGASFALVVIATFVGVVYVMCRCFG